jgi:hypothetical protein
VPSAGSPGTTGVGVRGPWASPAQSSDAGHPRRPLGPHLRQPRPDARVVRPSLQARLAVHVAPQGRGGAKRAARRADDGELGGEVNDAVGDGALLLDAHGRNLNRRSVARQGLGDSRYSPLHGSRERVIFKGAR